MYFNHIFYIKAINNQANNHDMFTTHNYKKEYESEQDVQTSNHGMFAAHKSQVWHNMGWSWCICMHINHEYEMTRIQHLIEMAKYNSWEFLGKGSRPRGVETRCYLKGLFEPRHHLRVFMNKIMQSKENSMPLRLTRGFSTIWKIYLNPRSRIGLKWEKPFWKWVCNFMGPTLHGFTWGLVLFERLT